MARIVKATVLLFLVSVGVSWGLVLLADASGLLASPAGRIVVLTFYPAGPLLGALITQRWLGLSLAPESFGVRFAASRWLPAAWFLPVLIAGVVLLFERRLPGVTISFDPSQHLPPLPPDATAELKADYEAARHVSPAVIVLGQLGMALFFGALMNTLIALAQEIAWRGVLLRILAPFGFWRSAILTGLLVAVWSFPLVLIGELYAGATVPGLALVVLYSLAVAPLIAFLRIAGGTVVAAALFQGSLVSLSRFVDLFYLSGSHLWVGIPGAVGLATILAFDLIIVVPQWHEVDAALRDKIRIELMAVESFAPVFECNEL